jgi:predicted DNA-binding transcriptional regulator AlpA
MSDDKTTNVDRLRSANEAAEMLAMSKKTLTRLGQRGEGPRRVQVSERIFGYRESEIQKFIDSRTK